MCYEDWEMIDDMVVGSDIDCRCYDNGCGCDEFLGDFTDDGGCGCDD